MQNVEVNRPRSDKRAPRARKFTIKSLPLATLALLLNLPSLAQDRPPTMEQMHAMFENAARQANLQMSNTRVDDHTILKLMTYDRKVPVMTYHYTSTALAALKKTEFDSATRQAMIDFHRGKTCGTQFAPFMRAYGLKVAHRFEDAKTGRELITVTVVGQDCTK